MDKKQIPKGISDMYMAAAVIAYGAIISNIDSEDQKRKRFFFDDGVENVYIINEKGDVIKKDYLTISEFERYYLLKRLLFPPSYPDAIRQIKTVIYSD